jgi:hypothetical protein
MSKSNASAKNRRAFGGNPPPIPAQTNSMVSGPNYSQASTNSQGFTLPQVISVIDSRLLHLEKFMKDTKEQSTKKVQFENTQPTNSIGFSEINAVSTQPSVDVSVNGVLEEFSARFDMIAEEVASLKDIVLKLQSYTMDVNKTLLEERIHILSDLGSSNQPIENQMFELSTDPNRESLVETIQNTDTDP